MGASSLVQWRWGIFRPSVSPSRAENTTNSRLSTAISAVSAAAIGSAMTAHTRHTSIGIAVSSSWNRSLARSTCHGVTGRDWSSHRLFPSRDTEGAAMSFMAASIHSAAVSITDRYAPASAPRAAPKAARMSGPFHSRVKPASGISRTPIPQLSM